MSTQLMVFMAMVILMIIIVYVFSKWFHWNATKDLYLTEAERSLFTRGYVFVNLWNLENLQEYANEIGVYFTREDYAKIIKMIKDDFTPENGISKGLIVTYMHIYRLEKARESEQPPQQIWGEFQI